MGISISMAYILAFDTCFAACNGGILNLQNGKTAVFHAPMERGQAENLVPLIETLMRENKVEMKDIAAIGVTVGPGSFTGTRVGPATARTLALARNIPVIGVETFDVYYEAFGKGIDDVLVAIDTKRDDFYAQIYKQGKKQSAFILKDLEFDGTIIRESYLADDLPDFLLPLVAQRYRESGETKFDLAKVPQPAYLREADVTMPKKAVTTGS
ncbi:MAG: tRNA (adenosine(37)-N6)-threonylcarbamoyltransferase complex dimerization subunit type 1 TsaB [Alphaproteobacteria bacterium]|nr:tRNA (adenosine(37)-N6)-threonylcarbamoyltransferase complex dimerization subunit type 1 TsaB [Alphaproteobacteria bacterium]